jgi:hypothetical protein
MVLLDEPVKAVRGGQRYTSGLAGDRWRTSAGPIAVSWRSSCSVTVPDTTQADPSAVIGAIAAQERPTLEAFLDYYRAVVVAKVSGMTETQARSRLVPSATTLAGIIRHLRLVEIKWFCRTLDGRRPPELPGFESELAANNGFVLAETDTVDGLVAAYEAQCAVSRSIAAGYELADTAPHPELGQVSLRWIYVHMIDETARHAGHADILREQLEAQQETAGDPEP